MTSEALDAAPVDSVWEALARSIRPGPHRPQPVAAALHRVLAADARAALDFPPFDRAVMDGYAVRSSDFADGRAVLANIGLARAGLPAGGRVAPGTCIQINTGAPVPAGADAVVVVEKSKSGESDRVELCDTPSPGQHIEPAAKHLRGGDLLLRAGTRITPGALAALVAGGVTTVEVFERPRVAIAGTGDEIVRGERALQAGQIYDSNSVALRELVTSAGSEAADLGGCPDDAGALREQLARGLEHDVLCVSGGMSKGSHDLVPAMLGDLGVQWLVRSLHMKPGKPLRIGRAPRGTWILGLPGNPVSCIVCFLLFGRPILDGLQGLPANKPAHIAGRLAADMPAVGARPMYQPGEWFAGPHDEPCVRPIDWRGSGDPFGMATANALIHRPERAGPAHRGEMVRCVPLDRPQ